MAITSTITQNVPAITEQVVFFNPSEFENISYSSRGITYAVEISSVLSQVDFIVFYQNLLQFYNSILLNFPTIANSFNTLLPVCQYKIFTSNGPNLIQYTQTSTASPITSVYNITYDKVANTATFARRLNPITITLQEFLTGFQWFTQFFNQIKIN